MKKTSVLLLCIMSFMLLCTAKADGNAFMALTENGERVVITNERVSMYSINNNQILWSYDFSLPDSSIQNYRLYANGMLRMIIRTDQKDVLYSIDLAAHEVTSSSLSNRIIGPVYFLNEGITYLNQDRKVIKVDFCNDKVSNLPALSHYDIGGLFGAESSESCTYLCLSILKDEVYQKNIVNISEDGEILFTYTLSGKSSDIFLQSSATIGDTLILALQTPFTADGSSYILWISKSGQLIKQELISNTSESITLVNDPHAPLIHVFVNNNARIVQMIFDEMGNQAESREYQVQYPFSSYYFINDEWCIWDSERKTYERLTTFVK